MTVAVDVREWTKNQWRATLVGDPIAVAASVMVTGSAARARNRFSPDTPLSR